MPGAGKENEQDGLPASAADHRFASAIPVASRGFPSEQTAAAEVATPSCIALSRSLCIFGTDGISALPPLDQDFALKLLRAALAIPSGGDFPNDDYGRMFSNIFDKCRMIQCNAEQSHGLLQLTRFLICPKIRIASCATESISSKLLSCSFFVLDYFTAVCVPRL